MKMVLIKTFPPVKYSVRLQIISIIFIQYIRHYKHNFLVKSIYIHLHY